MRCVFPSFFCFLSTLVRLDEAGIKWRHTEEQKVIGNQLLNYFVDAKVIDESEQTSFKGTFRVAYGRINKSEREKCIN